MFVKECGSNLAILLVCLLLFGQTIVGIAFIISAEIGYTKWVLTGNGSDLILLGLTFFELAFLNVESDWPGPSLVEVPSVNA